MDIILSGIETPTFPNKEYLVKDFGAKGDGKTDCTDAFKKAIAKCSCDGGGKVIVPEGKYLTGAIHLKSNVNLYISKGAELLFKTDPSSYLPVVYSRWEGVELMNYSPLIYAYGQKNIAITGKGILNGQAGNTNWWTWKGREKYGWEKGMPSQKDKGNRPRLFELAEESVPVEKRIFGEGHYLRPPFVQPYRCEKVLIEGVTIINSPM